jgi:hypothetical protein
MRATALFTFHLADFRLLPITLIIGTKSNVRLSLKSRHSSVRSGCRRRANSDQRTAAAFYSISSNNTRIHGSHLAEPFTASEADGPLKVEKSSEKW